MNGADLEARRLCESLARYDTPALANAVERFDVRPRDEGFTDLTVRRIVGDERRMVGYAVTARLAGRGQGSGVPLTDLVAAIDVTTGPRIVVIEDLDVPAGCGSLLGEVTGTYFNALGCTGFLTNGGVRDIRDVARLGLSVYAAAACVSHAYVRIVDVGGTVTIGGLTIAPGDLLHGDEHGVLSIPREIASEVCNSAEGIRHEEQETIAWVYSGEFSAEAFVERRRRVGH